MTYTAAQGRKFGFTVGGALVVLGGIARWRGHPTTFVVLAALGAALILMALVAPAALGPVERTWMKLAHAISKVTTPIFMGIIYYLVLTPIGVIRRSLGHNGLVNRPGAMGLWGDRSATARSNLDRLF